MVVTFLPAATAVCLGKKGGKMDVNDWDSGDTLQLLPSITSWTRISIYLDIYTVDIDIFTYTTRTKPQLFCVSLCLLSRSHQGGSPPARTQTLIHPDLPPYTKSGKQMRRCTRRTKLTGWLLCPQLQPTSLFSNLTTYTSVKTAADWIDALQEGGRFFIFKKYGGSVIHYNIFQLSSSPKWFWKHLSQDPYNHCKLAKMQCVAVSQALHRQWTECVQLADRAGLGVCQ